MHRIKVQDEDYDCYDGVEGAKQTTNVSQVIQERVGDSLVLVQVMIEKHLHRGDKNWIARLAIGSLHKLLIFELKSLKNRWSKKA